MLQIHTLFIGDHNHHNVQVNVPLALLVQQKVYNHQVDSDIYSLSMVTATYLKAFNKISKLKLWMFMCLWSSIPYTAQGVQKHSYSFHLRFFILVGGVSVIFSVALSFGRYLNLKQSSLNFLINTVAEKLFSYRNIRKILEKLFLGCRGVQNPLEQFCHWQPHSPTQTCPQKHQTTSSDSSISLEDSSSLSSSSIFSTSLSSS